MEVRNVCDFVRVWLVVVVVMKRVMGGGGGGGYCLSARKCLL